MMVHGASHGIAAKRVAVNTSLIDILPTLADLIGEKLEKRREGVSLMSLLRDDANSEALTNRFQDRCLFGHRMYSSRRKLAVWSITCKHWKLIDWWGDRRKLFDHRTDRGEYHNLFLKRPKTVEELYGRLVKFKSRMENGVTASEQKEIELDGELLKKLRSLGYVE
jgi:arylsulfatase A-like enzyme